MPGWPDHAIWWQVYPLGFTGAPTAPGSGEIPSDADAAPAAVHHRLPALVEWLDDLVELGCNGLLLGPIFASSGHGYDTIDHFRVDARLGDDADVDLLIAECRRRGIRVLLDGVFNHVSAEHPWWRAALGGDAEARALFRSGDDGAPSFFEGHDALVELDPASPRVREHVLAVMRHWLTRGIDGWRLDAAYALPPEFWRETVGAIRSEFPEAWFLGEVLHGDYVDYVERSGLDSVTQYELWKAIRSSIDEGNLFELAWSLERHDAFSRAFLPQTFVGNHDVTRIASAVSDPRHLGHVLAILFFVAGSPSVYAGDERGMRAIKEERMGGDDAIRPAFPATPGELDASLPDDAADVRRLHERLIGHRRRLPWLAHAAVAVEQLANESALLVATGPDGERATLALNLSDSPVRLGGATVHPHDFVLDPA